MAYASGGVISATDYNGLAQNNSSNIAYVWGTGSSTFGYGQSVSALSPLSTGTTVTATQWSGLLTVLNNANLHQGGTSLGPLNYTAGEIITYFSNVTTTVDNICTNRALYGSSGATIAGNVIIPRFLAPTNDISARTWHTGFAVTFASADQARYFFNAGGRLNLVTSSATNNDGTNRTADWCTFLATNMSTINGIGGTTNSGKSGAGGTVNTNNTSIGYWNAGGSNTSIGSTMVNISTTGGAYNGAYLDVKLRTVGVQGNNSDVGNKVYVDVTMYSPTQSLYADPAPNSPGTGTTTDWNTTEDQIDITWNARLDVVYPETTYLSNSWGPVHTGLYIPDLYEWAISSGGAGLSACSVSDSSASAPTPFGNALAMTHNGSADAHVGTYSAAKWNLCPAISGQTFEWSVWIKADSSVTIEGLAFMEADAAGTYLSGGSMGAINVTTSWQRFTGQYTMANGSCAFAQTRLDGVQGGGFTGIVYWAGFEIRRVA